MTVTISKKLKEFGRKSGLQKQGEEKKEDVLLMTHGKRKSFLVNEIRGVEP